MYGDVAEILYSREQIDERVKELAAQITGVYQDRDLTVAVTLTGAFIFAADLVRHLPNSVRITFVRASSYRDAEEPQQVPQLDIPELGFDGRHVLIVEDIVDTGRTAVALIDAFRERGAASVRVCSFLDKTSRREVDVDVEFIGFTLTGSPFVVGYGLDRANRYRNLPFVGVLKPEVING